SGDMTVTRAEHTATLLSDGTVLIAGGYIAFPRPCCGRPIVGATAEIYNPAPSAIGLPKCSRDFDGDGKSDILRQDPAGNVFMGLMNGAAITNESFIANVWSGWSIVGCGDFNGDGKADILWRDNTGNVAIWLMNGTTIASFSTIANIWTGWSIIGVG